MYENIKLLSFTETEQVQEFVKAASRCDFEIDVKYNSSLIDAKSLLGVMNIGLCREFKVCYAGANKEFENVVAKLAVA